LAAQKRKIRKSMTVQNAGHRILQFLPLMLLSGLTVAGWCLRTPGSLPRREVAEAAEQPYKAPPVPQPWVFLADPAVARRLQITPQHRIEIARIDAELDREAQKMMQAAIQGWEQRGGFHIAPIPNFRDGSNPYGRRLNALKRAAEDKIVRLLSE